ncbi:MAG: Fpg/Nei family DNA glycosylase [Geodermatophilaceae bacterium]|nr:Fpg/Nei family DNA glycosylase [Geodermatophilaceae bacterium]
MPEGDTVWLTARRLNTALADRALSRADLRVPALATTDLTGMTVRAVVSRGKHLLTRLDSGLTLRSHLRMDGSWRIVRTGRPWSGGPAYAVRAVLGNPEWECVGYRVHDLAVVPTDREAELVGHLGPDLLGPDWDAGEAVRRLLLDPAREIGQALLDQRTLAGIGNMYKAELLFLRGVHPFTPTGTVGDLPGLVDLAHRMLSRNKDAPEQSTTGSNRRGENFWVYLRTGRPCLRCGTAIVSADQGVPPYQRPAFWCPTCQPVAEVAARPSS